MFSDRIDFDYRHRALAAVRAMTKDILVGLGISLVMNYLHNE